ncbi:probable G-protein coupled receptor 149 [Panthera pardus]|uniref:Probable G-protein coupled receptor 149 n=1 Tax=Panthera pardus TaxID=9691 RepID=A0A9V1F4U2_PANPR|nr:probable G-protein coupled receptor 149 [Panthera tigris]XP_019295573.1 probable G-protein coupled receptor 149 [Panthera pardus]XP_042810521.1 probable G-protein coupled receptor 149 [Panthera leo]XP_060495011.1 probable G-protein coupled receptor 149 [Panthera onca]
MSGFSSNLSTNDSTLWKENHNSTDLLNLPGTLNIYLFCLTCLMTLAALAGSIYSLVSLLKTHNRTVVSMLVASWSGDDLMSVLSVTIFMFLQWPNQVPDYFQALCTTSALLYLCQGLSSNLKATLLVSYNFYSMHRAVGSQAASRRSGQVLGVVLTVWAASLLLSALPLCGWGTFVRTPWGCLADCSSSYVLLLFAVYTSAFGLLAGLSVPLTHQLLCSEEPPRLHANYQEISRGASTPGTPPSRGGVLSLSPDDAPGPALRCSGGCSPSSDTVFGPGPPARAQLGQGPGHEATAVVGACRRENRGTLYGTRSFTVSVAQKRFSLILALTKVILWLPMMIHMMVQHVVGFQSPPFETLSFLLTLLATTVTPVFVLSKRWTHLPCGCIINCKQNAYTVASDGEKTKRRGFEFNLSFQRSYGIYKIAREDYYDDDENSTSYHNLMNSECKTTKDSQRDTHNIFNAIKVEISTTPSRDSSVLKGINKCTNTDIMEAKQDCHSGKGVDPLISEETGGDTNYEETTFLEGPERRLSHEESQKPDLSDWEWCRSKSERTPRQRSGGALAIPLCAFQGTVSLQAPTGKTLSLSTYEVSAEGQKITPASKKIEVYRSKSVGHEPNSEDSPSTFADTSVKIHLEVLEICDNEEALDTVSIISNISQSSTQVRSPSLRYSRKENRFVSCDLGETASYSLFLPTSNPDGDINISIPDTVEAHRQNSKRQHQEKEGYQEEIQLLNKAYRKREEEGKGNL